MAPCINTARELLRQGASLREAAQGAGFPMASDLDLALWRHLGFAARVAEREPAPRPEPRQIGLPTGAAPVGRPIGSEANRAILKALLEKRDATIRSLISQGYSPDAMAERFGLPKRYITALSAGGQRP